MWLTVQKQRLPLTVCVVVAMLFGIGVLFFMTWAKHPSADPTTAFVLGLLCLAAALGLAARNPLAILPALAIALLRIARIRK
jgi:hypothetical protein